MTNGVKSKVQLEAMLRTMLATTTDDINPPIRVPVSTVRPLILSNGTLEALRWLALLLMTLDHINKHLLYASAPELFATLSLAFPLFGFVLGYNSAPPSALAHGAHSRTSRRLALVGSVATLPFTTRGGLGWGWWPLNIMATLLVATLCAC